MHEHRDLEVTEMVAGAGQLEVLDEEGVTVDPMVILTAIDEDSAICTWRLDLHRAVELQTLLQVAMVETEERYRGGPSGMPVGQRTLRQWRRRLLRFIGIAVTTVG